MSAEADTAAGASRYASRKFLLTVAVLVVGAIYRETGALSQELWVDLTKWTLGLYFGANVGTWLTDAIRSKTQ